MSRELVIVHTSDVHVDHGYTARAHGGDGAGPLRIVLDEARKVNADMVLLVGDTFDSHKTPQPLIERVGDLIRAVEIPVVLLPGNHDPVVEDALWHKSSLRDVKNLHVIGVDHDELIGFEAFDLDVWGKAHAHYGDMDPLGSLPQRRARWHIALAHGHYEPQPDRSVKPRASWLIGDDEIDATGADYLALGHWNRHAEVGRGKVPAFYSGSPDYARSVNLVRITPQGLRVDRHAIEWPYEERTSGEVFE